MAVIKSNGVAGGERRRKPRAGAAAARAGEGAWLGRIDALADVLAGLDDRSTIVDHVVSETMSLLPADEVVVRADATTLTAPFFTEENEQAPARAVIPLVIGGRHFGAVEIAMKPRRAVGPGERTLTIALARQCALALDSLALRKAQRETGLTPPPPDAVTPQSVRPSASPAGDPAAVHAALGRVEADLRALAKLARSAELPPTIWVDQAERKALRDIEDLRAQLLVPVAP